MREKNRSTKNIFSLRKFMLKKNLRFFGGNPKFPFSNILMIMKKIMSGKIRVMKKMDKKVFGSIKSENKYFSMISKIQSVSCSKVSKTLKNKSNGPIFVK